MLWFNRLAQNNPTQNELLRKLSGLRPQMAQIAQSVYNLWDESDVDTYANGGICHIISEKISDFLSRASTHNIDSYTHSLDFKQHVVTIAIDHNQKVAYMIDIPETIYETGGGFSWKKINDVFFEENDVEIQPLDYEEWGSPQDY